MISARKHHRRPTADPTKLGATPILKKESRSQVYSSMHIRRDERITAMSKEISGRVVGPVRAEDFLTFSQSKSEFSMYKPWINLLAKFCPNLELVDAHHHTCRGLWRKQVKPDIQIYSPNFKRSGLLDITQTKMTVEFKIAVDDAFNDSGPFERSSKTAPDTLGQITLYCDGTPSCTIPEHMSSLSLFSPSMRDSRAGTAVALS
ncbi:hypothetical protein BU17DRAFT_104047 [Hysterangium stoloniferum]|nr:hypothetical protein BU17DRAFT_104047 [Hysterangium stoloniferum]